ncbi:hypothetical protein GGX14DRAFT_575448 [Mycena pura]|uniref:Uncharacterized protein n=1 Tax=Mycena pura TaxID=153505 RepID=A0AAD6UVA1_9AGAR|nr:hypothetical protein GGX14DRAFT_575448 [Mycena pura]
MAPPRDERIFDSPAYLSAPACGVSAPQTYNKCLFRPTRPPCTSSAGACRCTVGGLVHPAVSTTTRSDAHEIVEDYSDLVGGEDEAVLESKVADFKERAFS